MKLDDNEIFKESKSTLTETSFDDSSKQHMCDDEREVYNFAIVKKHYFNSLYKSEEAGKSVDALLLDGEKHIFIEFKNCKLTSTVKKDVRIKISDSLLIFNDLTGSQLGSSRNNSEFVLVYNEGKNPPESESRDFIASTVMDKAGEELVRFEFERYKATFFHDVHTYTENQLTGYLQNI